MPMRAIIVSFAALFYSLLAFQAFASTIVMPPITSYKSTNETVFSVGLRFSFSDMAPEVVGSVRNTTTDKDSDVTGIQGDVSVPVGGANAGKVKVRVLGLAGDRDALGQAGLGFDFGSNQPFAAVGVQGGNIEGGLNFGLNGLFDPYIGVNTFGDPAKRGKKNAGPVVTMPLVTNAPLSVPASAF